MQKGSHFLPSQEIGRLSVNVKDGKFLVALENVEPPFGLGFPRFARLAVLDQDTVDQVGVLQELAGSTHVNFVIDSLASLRCTVSYIKSNCFLYEELHLFLN